MEIVDHSVHRILDFDRTALSWRPAGKILQMPKNRKIVAFQGEQGAFSHAAARKLLGSRIEVFPCQRFDYVFPQFEAGVTDAVIPIENTLHGSVHENYDHLLEYDLPIVGETSIRIAHQLIAMPETKFGT